jgi:Transposase DDE domain
LTSSSERGGAQSYRRVKRYRGHALLSGREPPVDLALVELPELTVAGAGQDAALRNPALARHVRDLAQLYRARWNAELDLRSLKRTLQMDVLRGKTPELVRKEIWAHVLAYNLVRTIMAQAATRHGAEPRSISFKGAVLTLQAFQPVIAMLGEADPALCRQIYQQVLDAIATHRVADRPDRFEPRLRKRRPKHYAFLRKPRREVKRQMLNRFRRNYVPFVDVTDARNAPFLRG